MGKKMTIRRVYSEGFDLEKASQLMKEMAAESKPIKITEKDRIAYRKGLRENLMRAGYTEKEARKMTTRKLAF